METVRAKKYDVFVSYKREDDAAREILCAALIAAGFDPWWDAKLGQGDFRDQLRDQINRCDVTIALWSQNAHAKPDEVKMEMAHAFGLKKLLPLKLDDAPIPRQFAKENFLPFDQWTDKHRAANQLDHIISEARRLGASPSRSQAQPTPVSIPVDLGDLPGAPSKLVGREAEMQLLRNAWHDSATHVVVLHALGGAGKSALLRAFVNERLAAGGDGAARIYGWSAYSQGSGEQKRADADAFLSKALGDFGYAGPPFRDSVEAGRMLGGLVQKERVLMLLDGIEPLQDPPGPMRGRFKDKGLAALVTTLGAQNPGLLVVTSRQDVPELEGFGDLVLQHPLDQLSDEAGADLLVDLGVRGRLADLKAAAGDLYGHALSVTLLGTFLAEVCGGDIGARSRFRFGDIILTPEEHDNADRTIRYAKRIEKIIEAYLERFDAMANETDQIGREERALLRLLGLFDRPADGAAIDMLLAENIPGLTDDLFAVISEMDVEAELDKQPQVRQLTPSERSARLREAKNRLRRLRLLSNADPTDPHGIDSHPVVRAFFSAWLEANAPEAARVAHELLYHHYVAAAPDLPDSLAKMIPLQLAVRHGAKTALVQEALHEVFRRRMCREDQWYIAHHLGAFGAWLSTVSNFFVIPWSTPQSMLTFREQGFVLVCASHALGALGRLRDSIGPREAALTIYVANENWKLASQSGAMLSAYLLTLGDVQRAIEMGEAAVEYARKSEDPMCRHNSLTALASALSAAGQAERAMARFSESDALMEGTPRMGLSGYEFGAFLISQGAGEEALAQGFRQVEAAQQQSSTDLPLLSLGVSWLLIGRAEDFLGDGAAAESLDKSVESLRKANVIRFLLQALLARVAHRRKRVVAGEVALLDSLREDLAEVEEIAEPEMRLSLTDLALERAELALEVPSAFHDPTAMAATQIEIAALLIADTGYHHRDAKLAALRNRVAARPPKTSLDP